MTIKLTPEQERRLEDVVRRGGYESVDEVVEAALIAFEQRLVPGFSGTPEELDALLADGMASRQITEDEFWKTVNRQTDIMLARLKSDSRS